MIWLALGSSRTQHCVHIGISSGIQDTLKIKHVNGKTLARHILPEHKCPSYTPHPHPKDK